MTRCIHGTDMFVHVYHDAIFESGTHIFGMCLVYTWYIPCIYSPPTYTWHICGISMDIPCISIGLDIHGISLVYPWIYHVYQASMYMVYPRIYMVYHMMYTGYIRAK